MSLTSFEGVPKWSGNLWRIFYYWKFSRELLSFSFRLILSVVSSLFSGLLFYSALVWRVYLGSCLSPKGFLFYRGSKILGGTDPRLQEMYSIIFSLPSCLVIQRQRMSLGISSLISNGLILYRRRELNIGNTRNI